MGDRLGRHQRRSQLRLGIVLVERLEARHVIGMIVREKDADDRRRFKADRRQPATEFTTAQSAVNKKQRALRFDAVRVALGATGQRNDPH